MQTMKKQTQTTSTDAYVGGIIEELTSRVDMIKGVNCKIFAGLIPKIRHHNIRHQPMKHISTSMNVDISKKIGYVLNLSYFSLLK